MESLNQQIWIIGKQYSQYPYRRGNKQMSWVDLSWGQIYARDPEERKIEKESRRIEGTNPTRCMY
jgi:hypothetical protein